VTVDGPPIFEGAKRILRGTGLRQNISEFGKLTSSALNMLRLWHSSRNESRFDFLDTKAISFLPLFKGMGTAQKLAIK
jgi:hypothetical protein